MRWRALHGLSIPKWMVGYLPEGGIADGKPVPMSGWRQKLNRPSSTDTSRIISANAGLSSRLGASRRLLDCQQSTLNAPHGLLR